jgi:integrase
MEKRQAEQTTDKAESQSKWVKTPVSNLVRYKPSAIYFARVRIRGKLFRQSLKTTVMSVAKLRLTDLVKAKQEEMGDVSAIQTGKMTVGDAMAVFRQRLDARQDIKEGAKVYRRKCIDVLLRSWPGLESRPVGKVSKDECEGWAERLAQKYSPTVYNNTVGTARMIFDVAVDSGARAMNPARSITKKRIRAHKLVLPTPEQFEQFVTAIADGGGWCSRGCADLVRFLSYGGFRKTEAANITWGDCDFNKEQIHVRVTKNGDPRFVPMIPEMKSFLRRLLTKRPDAKSEDAAMIVKECQKSMDRAAKIVSLPCRFTHHTARHLFCTRALQCGVPPSTVSGWAGHKDGGALLLKTYSHLCDEHSREQAAKVVFKKSKRKTRNA